MNKFQRDRAPEIVAASLSQRRRVSIQREGRTTMLNELRNFDVDRIGVDEMIFLSAVGKLARAEYQNRGAIVPEWLNDQLAKLEREILNKQRDTLELRRKEIAAQLSQLETASEKRARLAAELEKVNTQLTGTTV